MQANVNIACESVLPRQTCSAHCVPCGLFNCALGHDPALFALAAWAAAAAG